MSNRKAETCFHSLPESLLLLLFGEVGCRLDEQHDDDGHDRGAGEGAKNDVERHPAVAQHAESPVGQAAATNTDEVHNPVAGSSKARLNDLREDRHVVAIEE